MRPCTGALLILMFTFTNHLYAIGMLATLAMAAGTAITVAGVGMGALGLRELAERGIGIALPRRALAVAGGAIIAIMGVAMASRMSGWTGTGPGMKSFLYIMQVTPRIAVSSGSSAR